MRLKVDTTTTTTTTTSTVIVTRRDAATEGANYIAGGNVHLLVFLSLKDLQSVFDIVAFTQTFNGGRYHQLNIGL